MLSKIRVTRRVTIIQIVSVEAESPEAACQVAEAKADEGAFGSVAFKRQAEFPVAETRESISFLPVVT